MVAATTNRLTTQPGPDALLSPVIPQPFVVFRPFGATQIARSLPGVVVSSTYTGVTAVGGPYGRGPRVAGGTSDGIEHVISQEMDRSRYAVAVMCRIESSGVTQSIATLHGGTTTGLQLRINTSNQLEALSEGAALLGTSTVAGFTAGTTHTIVALQQASGGPLVIFRNGAPILTIVAGHQLTAATVNVVFARRQQAGEKFAGTILEAAVWSEDVPSVQQALAISQVYFGAMFAPRFSVVPVSAGGGAQTVAIGQPLETDTAQAFSARQSRSIGQASETDAAQPIAARQLRAIGQASESNTAQAFAAAQRKAIGQATETDAAQALAASQRKAIGQSVEVDTAQPVAYSAPGVVGQATETDAAQPIAARQSRTIGQALESNAAQAITASTGTTVAIGLALEIDTAGAFAALGPIAIAIGQAQEVDLARAMTSIGGDASIDPATIRRVARSPALPRLARSPAPWRSTNGL